MGFPRKRDSKQSLNHRKRLETDKRQHYGPKHLPGMCAVSSWEGLPRLPDLWSWIFGDQRKKQLDWLFKVWTEVFSKGLPLCNGWSANLTYISSQSKTGEKNRKRKYTHTGNLGSRDNRGRLKKKRKKEGKGEMELEIACCQGTGWGMKQKALQVHLSSTRCPGLAQLTPASLPPTSLTLASPS